MASATYNYGFPYPTNSDNVDIPGDIEALAEALDLKVLSIDADITTLQDTSAYSAQVSASIDTAINELDAQVSASMVIQNNNMSASVTDLFNNKSYLLGQTSLNGANDEYATLSLVASGSAGWVEYIAQAPNNYSYLGPGDAYLESDVSGPQLYLKGPQPKFLMHGYGQTPYLLSQHFGAYGSPINYNVFELNAILGLGSASTGYSGQTMANLTVFPTVSSASPSDINEYGGKFYFQVKRENTAGIYNALTLNYNLAEFSGNLSVSGSAAFNSKITAPSINTSNITYSNAFAGYSTTTASAGTLTLSASSNYQQFFTGSAAHTVVLPSASTMVLGQSYSLNNKSTGTITVNSSGGNLVTSMPANSSVIVTCVLNSGTTAASWATNGSTAASSDTAVFARSNNVEVVAGTMRWPIPYNAIILDVQARINTAPTGAAIILDINKNGTTIFTTQANRPTIPISGNTTGVVTNMDIKSLSAGDYLTVDIDQIGSTIAGADLSVFIRYREV